MPVLLAVLAIFPGIVISWWIFHQDKHEKEPHRILLISFFVGMLTTIPAIYLEEFGMRMGIDAGKNIFITAIFAFVVVGGSEELSKFFGLRFYSYARDAFNEPLDGIVYSVMVSMGFATLENIMYIFELGFETGLLRMFTAVPAHAAFAVIMGYYVGLAKFDPENRIALLAKGVLAAVLLHGAYDFFLFQQFFPGLALLAFVALFAGIRYSRQLIKLHQQNSPFNKNSPSYIPLDDAEVLDDSSIGFPDLDTSESMTDYEAGLEEIFGEDEEE